jgi:2-aminoadipate transaminase
METALRASLGDAVSWVTPRGGFFLWITLPGAIDTHRMISRAVTHGVIYVAGGAFFVDGTGANTLRLSFSLATPDKIVEGVGRLTLAIKEEVAALGPSMALAGR